MSYPDLSGNSKDSGASEAERSVEETLRLIARLPAPEGLEERVKARLQASPRTGRVLAWPSPMVGGWLRAAAAAAIVFVVAGGGWGIYSRVLPGQPSKGIGGPGMAAPGGFTEGGAVRRPQTLMGPVVTVPVVTGPVVSGPATSPAVKASAQDALPKTKPSAKAAVTKMPGGRSAAENKASAQPAATAVR